MVTSNTDDELQPCISMPADIIVHYSIKHVTHRVVVAIKQDLLFLAMVRPHEPALWHDGLSRSGHNPGGGSLEKQVAHDYLGLS